MGLPWVVDVVALVRMGLVCFVVLFFVLFGKRVRGKETDATVYVGDGDMVGRGGGQRGTEVEGQGPQGLNEVLGRDEC